jgi:hypothetical protein
MGWPIGPRYDSSSNVVNAHRLQRELLLLVGEMDENVDPSSTWRRTGTGSSGTRAPGAGRGTAGSERGGEDDSLIQWDRKMGSVTWNYYFGREDPELQALDSLIKRLGLPATRWDLARRRAVAPILSWPALRKRSWEARPKLFKLAIRSERALVLEEARVLRELLSEVGQPRSRRPGRES